MKRALVTGHRGFIGRHFHAYLLRCGWEVRGVDLRDPDCPIDAFGTLERMIPQAEYDLIVHAAANVGGRQAIDHDPLWIARNLALDQAAIRATVKTGAHLLYFSSSAVYPVALQARGTNTALLSESSVDVRDGVFRPQLPDSVYGWAKLTGEYLVEKARAEGAKISVVRPFSGYGHDQDVTYPFRAFMQRAIKREDPFQIWGDGTQQRDWVHIKDVLIACMSVVDSGTADPVNLCTGRSTSFLELAGIVTKATGYSPVIEPLPDKPTGVWRRVGNPGRLHRYHVPEITIEEGVEMALRAYTR